MPLVAVAGEDVVGLASMMSLSSQTTLPRNVSTVWHSLCTLNDVYIFGQRDIYLAYCTSYQLTSRDALVHLLIDIEYTLELPYSASTRREIRLYAGGSRASVTYTTKRKRQRASFLRQQTEKRHSMRLLRQFPISV